VTTLAPRSAPAELAAYLDEVRTLIDAELDRRLRPPTDDPGRLVEAMRYAATGPGKRLRPAVVLAAAQACGGARELALPAAVAIELLHAYTLVHDDLPAMDDDDERRGRPTVHVAFGEAIAILAGDGLLTQAFATLAELGPRTQAAVAVLARRAGAHELLAGQALDLAMTEGKRSSAGKGPRASLARGNPGGMTGASTPPDLTTIERLHAGKTGALFAAAAELGAISAGAPPQTCAALARYGMAIGIAFQHADDRDDQELVEHAERAATRIRELAGEARTIAAGHGAHGAVLVAIAEWFASRA
jgi:geranylgeranyl pyrophosphate synthase